ncbi:MAG: FecR domain-containing protein [Ferruginibacter sp.]
MESQENYKVIFEEYLDNQCSPEEVDWLLSFLKSKNIGEEVEQILERQLSGTGNESRLSNPLLKERLKIRLDKILEEIAEKEDAKVIPFNESIKRRFNWSRLAAAAVIIFFLGLGVYYLLNNTPTKEIAKIVAPAKQDIAAPETAHATITLANGTHIILDSAGNGSLAMEGNVKIEKLDNGQIAYSGSSDEILYNTLTNPRGSKNVSITLSDGSKVWLNAGSSLKYPTSFTGNERKVTVTGEAYFEVSHNASKPFKVQNGETVITVLGTHFNVNAYEDEAALKVTLLEGSVEVKNKSSLVKIKPGQQAAVSNNDISNSILVQAMDIDKVIAWKNGLFVFENADLATIMRQVSRWYDVDVVYDGKPTDARFGGGLSKSLPLSNVLKLMEANGVKFKLEGKVLRVIAP